MSVRVLDRPRSLRAAGARHSVGMGRWGLRATAALYLGGMILLPLIAVSARGFGNGLSALQSALAAPGAIHAIELTLVTAAATAVTNAIFGTLLAYVLVRFTFPGRALLSAFVDLPFAIPTLVTGVMLVALYGPASPIGEFLARYDVKIAFAPLGILVAMLFVTLPFVVRTVQPVLSELDPAEEEAAFSLGAGGWTTFRRIVLPALRPAITAGALLAFARALGEFGAIVIISGNITGKTVTAPYFIFQLTNNFMYEEAAAVATVMFTISFILVLVTERLIRRRKEER